MSNTIESDTLVEAVARGIAKAKGIEICSDASYRHSTFGPLAQAALTAITEAGYAVVPKSGDVSMVAAFWRQRNTGSQVPGAEGSDTHDMAAMRAAIEAGAATNNGKAE